MLKKNEETNSQKHEEESEQASFFAMVPLVSGSLCTIIFFFCISMKQWWRGDFPGVLRTNDSADTEDTIIIYVLSIPFCHTSLRSLQSHNLMLVCIKILKIKHGPRLNTEEHS